MSLSKCPTLQSLRSGRISYTIYNVVNPENNTVSKRLSLDFIYFILNSNLRRKIEPRGKILQESEKEKKRGKGRAGYNTIKSNSF